jgi:Small, acid-soluble spore proteins, alpha/beta type.
MGDTFRRLTDAQRKKYEIAMELGLTERLREVGWAGLTAKESGRIGGKMGKKKQAT